MNDVEFSQLLRDLESDRVERKESAADGTKIRKTICAFANDLPNHAQPGVVFVGADDGGHCAHLRITDELLRRLSNMRGDGSIVPFPTMSVQKRTISGCELAVIIVEPADAPPVRFKGVTWIRVGPSLRFATTEEERRLAEKRKSKDLPFDLHPVHAAQLDDLAADLFQAYLRDALSRDVLQANDRSIQHQMVALRFLTVVEPRQPTVVGMLVAGRMPSDFIPGAYVQFLRLGGGELTDPIKTQAEIRGPLTELLSRIGALLEANISVSTDITTQAVESRHPDYPIVALQQIIRNAVMHRTYEATNAPVRITWFDDRVEVQSPGGPFGMVNRDNFGQPDVTDYRNPYIAEAMKNLGYVQRFGLGIVTAQKEMEKNRNPPIEFLVEDNHVLAVLRKRS